MIIGGIRMEKLTQKELDKIIKFHKIWLETKGRRGKQAVIIDKDLSGLKIDHVDFTEAMFKQCNMSNMKIRRAIFNGSEFNTVNLSESSICECEMRVSLLSNVNLEDTLFCLTNLGHSKFINETDLSKACLQGASLHLANTNKTYYKLGNYLNENTAVIYCIEDKLVSCGHYNCSGQAFL